MKVLWLASWYPSLLYPYDGDFIQRHANAAALFSNIEVIHVVKDPEGIFTNDVKETVIINDQLTERVFYYKPVKISIGIVDRLLSHAKYMRIYREAVKKYIAENGKPVFIHVHIAMKAGLVALWLKRKMNIPYLLTEHWGGYLVNANPNIRNFNMVFKFYSRKIIKGAKACSFVSAVLEKQLINVYKIKNSVVIPNVVNTKVFYPVQKAASNRIRFIHISIMTYQKNVEDILKALVLLKNQYDFDLYLFGTINLQLEKLIVDSGLQNRVFVKGEVSQESLAEEIRQSDALILYSRYETFGCVIIEANACGVPVIVSDLEVFHEIIEAGVNGIFAEGENPEALAEKLRQFILQRNIFDKTAIAATTAGKYNYKKVGQQFMDLYHTITN